MFTMATDGVCDFRSAAGVGAVNTEFAGSFADATFWAPIHGFLRKLRINLVRQTHPFRDLFVALQNRQFGEVEKINL
jgi:hypothetical protein